jgi:hypothetical protein
MLHELQEEKRKGLASAPPEIRLRVAHAGGLAKHEKRGLQAADEETRKRVARKGGIARGVQRRGERDTRARISEPI